MPTARFGSTGSEPFPTKSESPIGCDGVSKFMALRSWEAGFEETFSRADSYLYPTAGVGRRTGLRSELGAKARKTRHCKQITG
jgi:hypothetical protein